MRIQFKTGKHNPRLRGKIYSYTCSFRNFTTLRIFESSAYKLPKEDQLDWNKLYGRKSILPFGKWRKEQFYVWRWNPKKDTFQIAKYYRDGEKFWWDNVKNIGKFELVVLDNDWFSLPLPAGSYFGGNNPAPKFIQYILK